MDSAALPTAAPTNLPRVQRAHTKLSVVVEGALTPEARERAVRMLAALVTDMLLEEPPRTSDGALGPAEGPTG